MHACSLRELTVSIVVVVIVVAQFAWAHVLATFTGILIASDPHTRAFRNNMDHLNRFMHDCAPREAAQPQAAARREVARPSGRCKTSCRRAYS